MSWFADEYVTGAIVPDDMPEDLLGNPDVQRLIDNASAVIDHFEEWIDPNSEHYAMLIADTSQEAVDETKEVIADILREAVYREKLHGETMSLEDLLERVEKVEVKW